MYSIILVHRYALSTLPSPPPKHLLMIMCIILSVCECTLLLSLEAFVMTEVNETVSGRQPHQGVKQNFLHLDGSVCPRRFHCTHCLL
jgi:hypothetical protein